MIVKNQGKRDTHSLYSLSPLQLFHEYRELCFDLATAKRLRYLRPVLITTVVISILGLFTGIPSLISLSSLGVLVSLLMITFYLIPNMSPMPVEKSESGISLDLIPYPVTDEKYDEASSTITRIYGTDCYLTGSGSFQEKPIAQPIMIEHQPVVGIYAEVELADPAKTTEYYIMLETGQSLPIDREMFLTLSHTMHTTDQGLVSLPVLTGRHESMIWGTYGDAQAAITAAKRLRKPAPRVAAYRQAIALMEELLHYLALQNMATP